MSAQTWVEGAANHADWPIANLPLGLARLDGRDRIVSRIGDKLIDLAALAEAGLLPEGLTGALTAPRLNTLFSLPARHRAELREAVTELLSDPRYQGAVSPHLSDATSAEMLLPAHVGDYTDFYVGIHHATNIGKLFRPDNPLLPNYKWVPIGYHGRASSVRVSGAPLRRPTGQIKPPDADAPTFAPVKRLDYELELGVWIGEGNELGQPIPIGQAREHFAGLCLLNDWSARDIQAWEYQPLGPFLAKNFLTSVSPWVITAEALAPYRVAQPPRGDGDPDPLPYLADPEEARSGALSLTLEVAIQTERMRAEGQAPHRLTKGPATTMYWTIAQLIAHHSSNGCNLQPGDLLGTGTLSTPERGGVGSLMELSEGGKRAVELPNGETRTFLEDGDELILTGRAEAEGQPGFSLGECRGRVEPAG